MDEPDTSYVVRLSASRYTSYTSNTLGEVIRKARLSAGLSQTDLAELLGVNPTSVGRWEGYQQMPNRKDAGFLRACGVLGVDLIEEIAWTPLG